MKFLRGDLSTRLLILALAATAPACLVLVYLQNELHDDRRRDLAATALTQAELVRDDVASIVEGARQLTLAISEYPSVREFSPSCRTPLVSIARHLDSYDLLSVFDEDGAVLCSSSLDHPANASVLLRAQNDGAFAAGAFRPGVYMPPLAVPGADRTGAMLTFSQPFTGADGRRAVVVAGLSLKWLNAHFEQFKRSPGSTIGIADRNGTTLVRVPDGAAQIGRTLPEGAMALIDRPAAGNAEITGVDGRARLVGYVPISLPPTGLFSSVGLDLAGLLSPIDQAALRGYLVIGLGALLSLGFALLLGHRFVRRPTAALVSAAQGWSQGDVAARVHLPEAEGSEFGRIAAALNSMAEAFQRQRAESSELRSTLEARVADRTLALVASRDRLQVAMGEHAKTEATLRQAQKLQAVGQLAGGMAHDFNNLLTAVIGALEIVRGRLPLDDTRSRRLLDNALMAADRGGRLTAQLLAFSRRQLLLPVPTDLNAIVAGMEGLLNAALGREIQVQTQLAQGLWPALVDAHQVESALLNLALNARDSMEHGGTLVIATANVTLAGDRKSPPAAGDYIMIRVHDTGCGMSPEVLARAFEPFFTTKPVGSGSGLGLSQVYGLAAQSGGELRIESELGQGTVVSLLLPRAVDLPEERQMARPPVRHGIGRLRVLVADDDADVRDLTGEMLRELGHTPLLAAGGAEALERMDHDGSVDLLLADYAMPLMNGIALIAAAQARSPDLPAMLVTGHADVGAQSAPQSARQNAPGGAPGGATGGAPGGHALLRKPFSLAVLSAAIEQLMAKAGKAPADHTSSVSP